MKESKFSSKSQAGTSAQKQPKPSSKILDPIKLQAASQLSKLLKIKQTATAKLNAIKQSKGQTKSSPIGQIPQLPQEMQKSIQEELPKNNPESTVSPTGQVLNADEKTLADKIIDRHPDPTEAKNIIDKSVLDADEKQRFKDYVDSKLSLPEPPKEKSSK